MRRTSASTGEVTEGVAATCIMETKRGDCSPPLILPRPSVSREQSDPSELIVDLETDYPRTEHRLCDRKLRCVREQRSLVIGQVLGEHVGAPGILRDSERRIIG